MFLRKKASRIHGERVRSRTQTGQGAAKRTWTAIFTGTRIFPPSPPTFSGIGALIYPGKAPTEAFWRETNSKRSKKQSLRSPALPGYISPSGGSGKKIETLDCGGGEALPLRTHLSLSPSSWSFFRAEFTASSLPFLDRRDAFAVDRERERAGKGGKK